MISRSNQIIHCYQSFNIAQKSFCRKKTNLFNLFKNAIISFHLLHYISELAFVFLSSKKTVFFVSETNLFINAINIDLTSAHAFRSRSLFFPQLTEQGVLVVNPCRSSHWLILYYASRAQNPSGYMPQFYIDSLRRQLNIQYK